jgi:hypothetical protein
MNIELTTEQQHALDHVAGGRRRVVDPRTDTAYVLGPEVEFEAIRELLEDEERQRAMHAVGLRNAAARLVDDP